MSRIERTDTVARSILTKTSGALKQFAFSLNPYSGCTFGCTYCYAAFFTPNEELQASWGQWVKPKVNAPTLLARELAKVRSGDWVYMSSVTDPYMPIERELNLTRKCLQQLQQRRDIVLVIQTRGPLVTRDIDILARMSNVQVNISITTDTPLVRKAFEPLCPSIDRRLKAARELVGHGVQTCITLSPLLPISDTELFASDLLDTGVQHFAVDNFDVARGRFVSGTGKKAREIAQAMNWDDRAYFMTNDSLAQHLPELIVGETGFHFRGTPNTTTINSLFDC